jgi:hypothetical protein
MGRILIGILLTVALVAGSPYAALAIGSIMGTSTVTFTDYDGSQQTLTSGRNAPQPDWLPEMPGAYILSGARWAPSVRALDGGGGDRLTHADVANIRSFYKRELEQRGFKVEDKGLGTLDPSSAAVLGIAGTLTAERADTGHEVNIHIRTKSGLILRPRTVQIQWTQLSAEQKAAREALRQRNSPVSGTHPQ